MFVTDTVRVTSAIQLLTVTIYTTKSYAIDKQKDTKFLLTHARKKYTLFIFLLTYSMVQSP